jgi:uncharacterized protein Veg
VEIREKGALTFIDEFASNGGAVTIILNAGLRFMDAEWGSLFAVYETRFIVASG